jgi:hypothetical protein
MSVVKSEGKSGALVSMRIDFNGKAILRGVGGRGYDWNSDAIVSLLNQ